MTRCEIPGCAGVDTRPTTRGPLCSTHLPTQPAPDPDRTVAGLSARPATWGRPADQYGTARSDPLGRTIPGTNKNGMIPRRVCSRCPGTRRAADHKGDHTT